ncbi:tetratricopeptide repeat protein [Sphingomonas piscis]|uniref:Tetratricopeptide repeat protein n=1 Tax=Sphingomonas piscis TaxID=2714943 RepID=A0A6G7YNS7_9SPHN|nr:tetratricopeptide repeat protein [Sphingomonas piscis]QIK78391.1 tetratricopeptide repeat protein [Sphingomonas piscis]
MRPIALLFVAAFALAAPASGQRQPTPEQRIDRLEKQLRQVQGRVFQRGQPVDTAGFDYEPAAPLSSVATVSDRLTALERQMSDIQRLSEENGNRLRSIESAVSQLRTEQSDRVTSLERRVQELGAAPPALGTAAQPATNLQPTGSASTPRVSTPVPVPSAGNTAAVPQDDPGEEAYSVGFRLWQGGQYSQAIAALRQFKSTYPNHRRTSWANNLIGRALLDSGQPRDAATTLLDNYRSNPKGERAPDSLYYLGQALMKLNQPTQACNAYAELESIYGGKIRADLQKLLPDAKAQAQCR